MATEARSSRRGPKPNPDRGDPSGYRINGRTRFELQVAGAFVGATTLQATIDIAVQEFLDRLRRDAEGYAAALGAAERYQQRRSAIPHITQEHQAPD